MNNIKRKVKREIFKPINMLNTVKKKLLLFEKNDDGDLIAFKTNTGRELDYITALDEAKAGKLANIDVFHKYGREIIRSEPDEIKDNNLDNLPEF